jgi:hypothetical protein
VAGMHEKKRAVNYERSLLTYIDILGFRDLISSKTPNDISRFIRVVREAVEPTRWKTDFPELTKEEFANFSDLSIIWTPLRRKSKFPPQGEIHSQILRMVHAQSVLLFDESILIRGGITVGDVARSYGQLFGPAVVRAYDLESKVARFPRIVVGEEVLHELSTNPSLWVHDRDTDLKAVNILLRKDSDGEYFVDYLRVMEGELEEPSKYSSYLLWHQEFIAQGLLKYRRDASVVSKFKWLKEYHDSTVQNRSRP